MSPPAIPQTEKAEKDSAESTHRRPRQAQARPAEDESEKNEKTSIPLPERFAIALWRSSGHRTLVLWTHPTDRTTLSVSFDEPPMKTISLLVFTTAALLSAAVAQAPADSSPEQKAIVANDRTYEAAYAKADVATLVNAFADDAEYTTDDGRTFTGKAEIEAAIRAGLLGNKGSKLTITADSVRVLGPEAVMEKGSTLVTPKSGEPKAALFTAIYQKKEGKWKISTLLEIPMPVATAHDHLAELGWLIGEWEDSDKTNDTSVRSQYIWARGGNFMTRNVTVKRAGEVALEGWQVIGWDPVEERIRSWTFDGEGGFSEGRWSREGERWLLREAGFAADGSRTSADNTITKMSADRVTWESNNRTLDGDPQPSIGRIEINRVKGS